MERGYRQFSLVFALPCVKRNRSYFRFESTRLEIIMHLLFVKCVTNLTIISFNLSADTRESKELENIDPDHLQTPVFVYSTQINCSMYLHKGSPE